ncbi:MAG TPA: pyruvate, water dikinase regulatory protein [Anaerolineae bacterium]|nr:pyruvate, water dikinase regulatory protein [Anaerolineae bacterium]
MNKQQAQNRATSPPTLFVVSGSFGTSGEQIVRKVLAQFQGVEVPLKIVPRVHHNGQIAKIVDEASQVGGIIVNTLENYELTRSLTKQAAQAQVVVIDLVRSLLDHLASTLSQEPIGKPGLYRQLHETYFKRVEAIEYTLAHDDGKNHQGWAQAEIVLVGVSRVEKTPISLYLSMMGWKVANVPIVKGIEPHQELFQLDPRRVVGLLLDPSQLVQYRQHRQRHLNTGLRSKYVDPLN